MGKLSNTVLVFLKAMSVCTVCFNVAYNVLGEMHSWEKTYPGSPAPDKTLFSVVYRTEFYLVWSCALSISYGNIQVLWASFLGGRVINFTFEKLV